MTLQHKWPGAWCSGDGACSEYGVCIVCTSSLSWSGPHAPTCRTIYSMTQYFHIVKQIPGAKWWMMIDIRYQRLRLDAGTISIDTSEMVVLSRLGRGSDAMNNSAIIAV